MTTIKNIFGIICEHSMHTFFRSQENNIVNKIFLFGLLECSILLNLFGLELDPLYYA